MRAEPGRQVGIECVGLVTEYRGRKERCRPDEPGQFGQGPPVLDRVLARSGRLESGVGPAATSRSSRWNALPMTASSKWPAAACRVPALASLSPSRTPPCNTLMIVSNAGPSLSHTSPSRHDDEGKGAVSHDGPLQPLSRLISSQRPAIELRRPTVVEFRVIESQLDRAADLQQFGIADKVRSNDDALGDLSYDDGIRRWHAGKVLSVIRNP